MMSDSNQLNLFNNEKGIKPVTCKLCNKATDPTESKWMEPGKYYLCPACYAKVASRQASAKKPRAQNEVASPTEEVAISRDELIFLRSVKVLSLNSYIYLALRLDFPAFKEKYELDIEQFCDRWMISQYDFTRSFSLIAKKGVLSFYGGVLEFSVLRREDILEGLLK